MAEYAPPQNPASLNLDTNLMSRVAAAKEAVWFRIGVLQSTMNDRDRALEAFERVLAVNPGNVRAMTQAGAVLAKKELYPQAVAYLQRAINADSTCGEAWAVLAHCYVMTDDLQKAYQAYQSALSHLPNPKDPNLWYGIGLLYDRYGSLEHALEAFLLVLSIAPEFERADEVCFCIGIIYKEQQNFDEALKYFNKVVVAANPPPPLTRADGWYQIGHVSELKRDFPAALEMYKQALNENPKHPKTLQNLGWLEHQHNQKSSEAIRLLKMSADLDSTDGQTWYLLGRVYMALREFRQAYDAYQQAVYRDGRNATFWCSIGVLYYQMNQYRDAMDAYSRAIILNPHVSEVWYDLGTLYESCGQNDDAIDAYRRAAKLAPDNTQITARLNVLENTANSSNVAQPSQQPNSMQPNGSQPMQSIPPPVTHSQPPMHPGMQPGHGNDINSGTRQPLPNSLGSIGRSDHQSPPSHLHPPPQINPSTSLPQPPRSSLGLAPSSGGGGGGTEVAPIHPLSTSGGMSDGHPSNNQSYQHQHQHQHHHEPAPRSGPLSSQHPNVSNGGPVNSLGPMSSQPLTSQGPSNMLPPISSAPLEPINPMQNRSSPNGNHMSNATHPQMRDNESMQQHAIMSKDSHMAGGHHSNGGGRIPSPKGPQSIHSPQKASIHSDHQDGHSQSQGGYDPTGRGQNQQQQSQMSSPPGQQSHHSQHAPQPPTSMAQIPTLTSLPNLPPVQQGYNNDDVDKSERHRNGMNGSGDDRDHSNRTLDTGNTGPPYGPTDNSRRGEYESQGQHEDNRLPKLNRPDGSNDGSVAAQEVESNRSGYSGPMPNSSMGLPRDRIPSIRDSVGDANNSGPNVSRQMSLHDVTRQDGHDDNRLHGAQRHESSQREERDNVGPNMRDSSQQNGTADVKSDRLPSMNSLPAPMDITSSRNGQDDGDMQGPLPQGSPPSLSLPSSGALRSISVNDKPSTSPSHGASSPRNGSGMGASLPPLSSGRNSTSLSRLNQEAKDMSSSGGLSSSLGGLGSSLTKFGRAPPTPVSNTVVPSSLPSPLSHKAGNQSVHSGRSPRLSKNAAGGAFKAIQMPVPSANYVSVEQVPSPGSLPALPPMSRPNYGNGEDKMGKDKRDVGDERDGSDHRGDSRMKYMDDKGDKDVGESSGHGRGVSDDVLENKPVFGVLRPGNTNSEKSGDDNENNVSKMKSPASSPNRGGGNDSILSNKRDNMPGKDDMGRTPKRPRLHDVNDKDMVSKSYGSYNDSNDMDDKNKDMSQGRVKDEDGLVKSSGLSKSESFKDSLKRSSNGSQDDGKKHHRRDSGGSGSGGNNDMSKSNGGLGGGQVIELPRLSNQAMSKLSGPPLSGNQPLPSFRSERKNLSRGGSSGGGNSVGKSLNSDNGATRGLPFALRSAPAPNVATIPTLKSLGGGSQGGRGGSGSGNSSGGGGGVNSNGGGNNNNSNNGGGDRTGSGVADYHNETSPRGGGKAGANGSSNADGGKQQRGGGGVVVGVGSGATGGGGDDGVNKSGGGRGGGDRD